MDKNEFKNFITVVLMAVAAIITCATTAGSINFGLTPDGGGFYIFTGICNLGWVGLIGWLFCKRFIKKDDSATEGGAGAPAHSAPDSDNKTDEMKEGGK